MHEWTKLSYRLERSCPYKPATTSNAILLQRNSCRGTDSLEGLAQMKRRMHLLRLDTVACSAFDYNDYRLISPNPQVRLLCGFFL